MTSVPRRLPGGNRVEVTGESFYRDAITEVVGLAKDSFGSTLFWASLVPDPTNPYDKNAVKVMIEGKHVGHLDRGAAIAFSGVAARILELGCEVQCAAVIVGGGGKRLFGVVLDLGDPDACLECLK